MKLNFSLKHRSISFYLCLISSIIAIISSLVLFVYDRTSVIKSVSFHDYTFIAFIFMIIGGLLGLIYCFFDSKALSFLNILSAIFYACGVGQHLVDCCYPYADLGTSVPFFTNSGVFAKQLSTIFTIFLVLFILAWLSTLFACFLKDKKEN